jgi:hypothetical protein
MLDPQDRPASANGTRAPQINPLHLGRYTGRTDGGRPWGSLGPGPDASVRSPVRVSVLGHRRPDGFADPTDYRTPQAFS